MRKILLYAIFAALSGMTYVSCSDNNSDPTTDVTVYDIVCLESVAKSGTHFTLTKPAGGDLITYTTPLVMDTTRVKVGDRLMLAYQTLGQPPYRSGAIKPVGYSMVTNDTVRWGYISKVEDWDRDPVYMLSAWMSQDFLNMRARLPYDTEPRLLAVMVDSLTLDNPYPDCYLTHRLANPVETFERAYYISVDMKGLRRLPGCQGFNLILNNSNMDIDRYTFQLR